MKIKTNDLSPALKNDINEAVKKTLIAEYNRIKNDLDFYWDNVPDTNETKIKMMSWQNGALKEYRRLLTES